jgi:hypothetical protein
MRLVASGLERSDEAWLERAREARMSAVRLVRGGRQLGISRAQVASALRVLERTLRSWEVRWRSDRLHSRPLGRPRSALGRAQRRQALDCLNRSQGRVGVKSLMSVLGPSAARSALVDLKDRWRYAAHRRGGRLCARLEWTRAGAVWALDWSDPDVAIEGVFTKLLVVRDLASGQNLLSLPCLAESGNVAARELETLIRRHGAPAVVKSDNGKSLRCAAVQMVLAAHGILALVSPPRCPGYNGSCEAGIGALKVRIHHVAAASGRAREWSCDDVLEAQRALNTRVRENGLSAEDLWQTRRRLDAADREALWSAFREHLHAERALRGQAPCTELTPFEQASLDRAAISRALEEVGLVNFRRRWIRPPIRGRKVARKW